MKGDTRLSCHTQLIRYIGTGWEQVSKLLEVALLL